MKTHLNHLFACAGIGVAVLVGGVVPAVASTTSTTTSANLVKNPGAESAAGSPNGGVVNVPGWTQTTGTTFTAVKYGASGGFPTASTPGPQSRGKNFFAGGPGGSVVAVQNIALSAYSTAIKDGQATYALSGWLGGLGSKGDEAFVEVDFKNAKGFLVGDSATIGPITAGQRDDTTKFIFRRMFGTVPSGAHTAYLQLSLSQASGSYNDAFADNLLFHITQPAS